MACATNPWRIGYSRAAIQIFLIAFFALNAVLACLYATGFFTSEALEKQKEEIVHLWQSCIYNRFAHIHRFQHPFLRPEPCSDLTMAAAKRGEAGLKRARSSRVPGYYHPDIVDGNTPRFIQLDYFNSIFHLLGGFGAEALEIEGDGRGGRREMRVRSKFTGGEACVFHQQGNKTGDLAMFDVFNTTGMEVLFD
ncbi:unnamed protein product [Closterium sp. Naga37s-1]|nr:unnamed protein product [Closterium sp. Naga37s-1]